MRAGALKTRIEIWERVNTVNKMGDPVGAWTKKYTVWAQKKPSKAIDLLQANQHTGTIETRFEVRYNGAIRKSKNLIIYERLSDEWYDISMPIETDYARKKLMINAKLREQKPSPLVEEDEKDDEKDDDDGL